jgi:hypothetical protein
MEAENVPQYSGCRAMKDHQISLRKCRSLSLLRPTVKVPSYTFFTVHTLNGVNGDLLREKSGPALAETI